MFVWPAIFCLFAASGALGFPGAVSDRASHDSQSGPDALPAPDNVFESVPKASKTIDVSGIKTRIRLILEQTLDVGDKQAVSNSTSLTVKVDKRDVKCNASGSQCDCLSGLCDCSKGQCICSGGECLCPMGCQDKKPVSEESGSTTLEPEVRIVREADQKVKTGKGESDDEDDFDDDDEDEGKTKLKTRPQESDSEDIIGGHEDLPRRTLDQRKTKQNASSEYDDEEDPKNATNLGPRGIPKAMLHRERLLYVRSLSEPDVKGHKDVSKREVPEVGDWTEDLDALLSWTEEKPAYKNWDFLYPQMNQVRLKREAAKMGKPDGGSAKTDSPQPKDSSESRAESKDDATAADLKGNTSSHVAVELFDTIVERSLLDSGGPVDSPDGAKDVGSARVKRANDASTKKEGDVSSTDDPKMSATEAVPEVSGTAVDASKTSKPENHTSTGGIDKRNDTPAKVKEQVSELPRDEETTESNKPAEVTPKEVSDAPVKEPSSKKPLQDEKPKKASESTPQGLNGQEKQTAATMAEPKGDKAKKRLQSRLESSWGSDAHDSDKWQQERRLGDNRNVPDLGNLDIRYLGGNDLNIPPVDISNFHPEDVTGHETGEPGQEEETSPGKPVHLDQKQGRSASNLNMASCAILVASLAFVTTIKV